MVRSLVGFFALALLSGCAKTAASSQARMVHVAAPPPAPLPEAKSGPTNPEMVWVPGYWHWNGVRYVWIPGHWEAPEPGHAWQPPVYSFSGGSWTYRPGEWSLVP